jgi:signal transduction histidine kinase
MAAAAGAPVVLIALSGVARYRPADLLACVLSLVATGIVVVAAGIVCAEGTGPHLARRGLRARPSPPHPMGPAPPEIAESWSDPAVLSIDHWLVRGRAVAGAGAISWWVARLGAAGLLSALAFGAVGTHHGAGIAAAAVVTLALVSVAPGGRYLAAAALGVVAGAGALIAVSGTVALARGQLATSLLPTERGLPAAGSVATTTVQVATTVALLCLGAACLLAAMPAVSGGVGRQARRAMWAVAGTAVPGWGLAVPALVRAGGLSSTTVAVLGAPRALTTALSAALGPLGGPDAAQMARWLVFATCLAGAFGAAGAGTGLAYKALFTVGPLGSGGQRAPVELEGTPLAAGARLMARGAVAAATITGLLAGGAALVGQRPWLVVALGVLALTALALGALAPPGPPGHRRLPRSVRTAVATVWALAVAGALAAAGPWAVAAAGLVALTGAIAAGPERLRAAIAAVFASTRHQQAKQLGYAARILAERAIPALSAALDAVAVGEEPRLPANELAELRTAVRPLEAALASDWCSPRLAGMTEALVDASRQVAHLAAAVDAVARLDNYRLEELVEVRIGALAHANRNLVDSQWRRRQLLDRTVRVAEEERARIAANLHDGPIQRLAALGLVLDRCRLRLDRDDQNGARDLVKRARTELSEEIRSLRQMMSELRPPILDEGGLEAALQDHLSAWSATSGIESRFEAGPHGVLSLDSETVVYRVVQEALANVAKHSRADFTTVSMSQLGHGVQVVVRDNGRGFDAPSQPDLLRGGHFGLVVMRERVELASGRFEIHSAPRTGTEVIVWLPTVSASEPVGVA